MVNLEHRLTVDDLIVEYAMYKVKNGYEPKYSTSEFIDFLHFFETKMEVDDVLYDGCRMDDVLLLCYGNRETERSFFRRSEQIFLKSDDIYRNDDRMDDRSGPAGIWCMFPGTSERNRAYH